jgi:hypothetical protein
MIAKTIRYEIKLKGSTVFVKRHNIKTTIYPVTGCHMPTGGRMSGEILIGVPQGCKRALEKLRLVLRKTA